MKAYHIEGNVFFVDNANGTWCVVDNSVEQAEREEMSYNQAHEKALEAVVTLEDVAAWNNMETSAHLLAVLERFPNPHFLAVLERFPAESTPTGA